MLTLNSSDLGAGLKSPLWTSKASLNSEHSQRHGPSPLKSDLKKRRDFWFSLQIHFTPANWNLGSFRHWTIGKLNIGQLDNWAMQGSLAQQQACLGSANTKVCLHFCLHGATWGLCQSLLQFIKNVSQLPFVFQSQGMWGGNIGPGQDCLSVWQLVKNNGCRCDRCWVSKFSIQGNYCSGVRRECANAWLKV